MFAVYVGVNQTRAKGCDLQYAVNDAVALASFLATHLRGAAYEQKTRVLTSPAKGGANRDASKDAIGEALAEIAAEATPDDAFVFSFSGHGHTDGLGRFYILPSSIRGDCGEPSESFLRNAVASDELAAWLSPIDAGEMVMILDACYAAASIESQGFRPGPI